MGSRIGALKNAARKAGVSLEDYQARVAAGEKRCYKCNLWHPVALFNVDRSRADGRSARCSGCSRTATDSSPTRRDRVAKRAVGLNWCADCRDWLPVAAVRSGFCRRHANERDRRRYATDPVYRAERIAHAYLRSRGVEVVPPEGAEYILDEFGGRCAYCTSPAETWDHIHPVSRGGKTRPGNIVPSCVSCNSSKKAMDIEEWITRCPDLHPRFTEREILAYCGNYG